MFYQILNEEWPSDKMAAYKQFRHPVSAENVAWDEIILGSLFPDVNILLYFIHITLHLKTSALCKTQPVQFSSFQIDYETWTSRELSSDKNPWYYTIV